MDRIDRIKRLLIRRDDLHALTMLPSIVSPQSVELAKTELARVEADLDSLMPQPSAANQTQPVVES